MTYTLPELPYAYDALEPYIDVKQCTYTMINTTTLM